MRYGSVCSGIEGASVAWKALGWEPAWFSEKEAFPSAVLSHRFPGVRNFGDFTRIEDADPIGLLVGGTPCQSFSLAGLRGGLDDARGNLALEYIRLAYRLLPRWIVWENVPGVLSSSHGRDFASFLSGFVGVAISVPPKGWASTGIAVGLEGRYSLSWRVLDAQHFGVPQRRKRVFVVGHLGDWRRAASVLLEPESMPGDPREGRKAGQDIAYCLAAGAGGSKFGSGRDGQDTFIINAAESCAKRSHARHAKVSRCIDTGGSFASSQGGTVAVGPGSRVRRLTPRECERLQGFPDDWTLVPFRGKPAPDGHRYKAIGNSFPVPVVRWIGRRIDFVDKIIFE